jgi:hypothetical protein
MSRDHRKLMVVSTADTLAVEVCDELVRALEGLIWSLEART